MCLLPYKVDNQIYLSKLPIRRIFLCQSFRVTHEWGYNTAAIHFQMMLPHLADIFITQGGCFSLLWKCRMFMVDFPWGSKVHGGSCVEAVGICIMWVWTTCLYSLLVPLVLHLPFHLTKEYPCTHPIFWFSEINYHVHDRYFGSRSHLLSHV